MTLPVLNLTPTLRTDPSRTTTLRATYMADMRRRFAAVRRLMVEAIVVQDAWGLKERTPLTFHQVPEKEAFRFLTKDEKVKSFNKWFGEQVDREILNPTTPTGKPWTSKYVDSAYKKGSLRAYTDSHPEAMGENLDFYKGRREEFLQSAFNQPERLAKLRLLATRSFEDLKGITARMSQQVGRIMADGISHGLNPSVIARTMVQEINGITRTRAMTMARTEIINAHSEGQLDSFEEMGVKELQVMAEWSTAGDDRVCPECGSLEGVVMTVEEARGLIPRHPNCRCAWIPANVGEIEKRKKRLWSKIGKKQMVDDSLMARLPKRTRAGKKVPQTIEEAKRRSTWPGKHLKTVEPPAGVDLSGAAPKPIPKAKPKAAAPKAPPVPKKVQQIKPTPKTKEPLTGIRHEPPAVKDTTALQRKLTGSRGPDSPWKSQIVAPEQLANDPDAAMILRGGKLSRDMTSLKPAGKKKFVDYVAMKDGECHWNTAKLFAKGEVDDIVVGYAEHWDEGRRAYTWRQHTWGLKNGKIVETTGSNFRGATRYFGKTLSKEAAEDFAKWAAEHRPGEGMVRAGLKSVKPTPVPKPKPKKAVPKKVVEPTEAELREQLTKMNQLRAEVAQGSREGPVGYVVEGRLKELDSAIGTLKTRLEPALIRDQIKKLQIAFDPMFGATEWQLEMTKDAIKTMEARLATLKAGKGVAKPIPVRPSRAAFEKRVKSNTIKSREELQGASRPQKLLYEDGTEAVWKTEGMSEEVVASKVADIVGLGDKVPYAVRKTLDGVDGVLIEWKSGQVGEAARLALRKVSRAEAEISGVYDFMIGNVDRHNANFLIDARGKVVLIDHGAAFTGIPSNPQSAFGIEIAATEEIPVAIKKVWEKKLPEVLKAMKEEGLDDLMAQVEYRAGQLKKAKTWEDIRW